MRVSALCFRQSNACCIFQVAIAYNHPVDCLRIMLNGVVLKGHDIPISASGLYSGIDLTAVLFPKSVDDRTPAEKAALERDLMGSNAHPGRVSKSSGGDVIHVRKKNVLWLMLCLVLFSSQVLASHNDYFDVLFELLAPPHKAMADEQVLFFVKSFCQAF